MEEKFNEFQRILHRSKRYEFNGPELTISDYYTGKSITLDLSRIDLGMFEELLVENEEEYEEDDE